eukprot:6200590-Pleurochrysis_carterae.AAC.2
MMQENGTVLVCDATGPACAHAREACTPRTHQRTPVRGFSRISLPGEHTTVQFTYFTAGLTSLIKSCAEAVTALLEDCAGTAWPARHGRWRTERARACRETDSLHHSGRVYCSDGRAGVNCGVPCKDTAPYDWFHPLLDSIEASAPALLVACPLCVHLQQSLSGTRFDTLATHHSTP